MSTCHPQRFDGADGTAALNPFECHPRKYAVGRERGLVAGNFEIPLLHAERIGHMEGVSTLENNIAAHGLLVVRGMLRKKPVCHQHTVNTTFAVLIGGH